MREKNRAARVTGQGKQSLGSMDLNMYGCMFSALSFLLELKLKERCLLGLKRPSNAVYCPDKQKWV